MSEAKGMDAPTEAHPLLGGDNRPAIPSYVVPSTDKGDLAGSSRRLMEQSGDHHPIVLPAEEEEDTKEVGGTFENPGFLDSGTHPQLPGSLPGVVKSEADGQIDAVQAGRHKGKRWPQIYSAFAANMGSMALGAVIAWTATALPDLRISETFSYIDTNQESWIGSIMILGAALSCPVAAVGIEKWGRRKLMLCLTFPFVAAWLCIYFATHLYMLYAGRFITGFCGGAISIAAPVFVSETADASIRGASGSGFELLLVVGILYILVVGTWATWQLQALACAALPLISHILMYFVPESPRFLLEKGNEEEALMALRWLRGASTPADVIGELNELKESVAESRSRKGSWRDLCQMSVIKPTFIGFALMFFQQLSAIDAVTFYTVDIFQSAGSHIDEHLSAIVFGVAQVLATLLSTSLVDRSGRRILLMISGFFMGLSLTLTGVYFYLKMIHGGPPPNLGWLPLCSLTVYILSFSAGLGPIPWMMTSELVPLHVKGLAVGIVTISRWLLGFTVTLVFQDLMMALGEHGGFWFFAGFCYVATIYVFFFVPETKGKTLDEIQRHFQRKAPTPTPSLECAP